MKLEDQIIQRRMKDAAIMKLYKIDPFLFLKDMWGLVPQQVLPEYKEKLIECRETGDYSEMDLNMFDVFQKGRHITRQQTEIVWGVKMAVQKKAKRKITISSGHGIGKSSIISMLILWFLFVFKDCQIPCTSPSQSQMFDVLWKEVAKWLNRMPSTIKEQYEHQQAYIRMVENPKEWFARAATGRKENPEALAGVHADNVFMVADEASGVAEEVFNSSKGALTNENVILLMISNPTRLSGYFYNSHNKLKEGFQTFQFNGEDSPIVSKEFVKDIIDEHGLDSTEYNIRVKGEFPDEEGVDDEGRVNLIQRGDMRYTTNGVIDKAFKLGVDPAGDGSDEDIMVVRDDFVAKIASVQSFSNEKKTAGIAITLLKEYKLKSQDCIIDNFGVGANVGVEMAAARFKPVPVNVGDKKLMRKKELKLFENPRAKAYWDLRTWLRNGGELVNSKKREDLLMIKYKRNLNGKIQIMSKKDMKKKFGKSPDCADALMLTFIKKRVSSDEVQAIIQEF